MINNFEMNSTINWGVEVTPVSNGDYEITIIDYTYYPYFIASGIVPSALAQLVDEMLNGLRLDAEGLDHGYSPAPLALYLTLMEYTDSTDPHQNAVALETITSLSPRCAYAICNMLIARPTIEEVYTYLFNHPNDIPQLLGFN